MLSSVDGVHKSLGVLVDHVDALIAVGGEVVVDGVAGLFPPCHKVVPQPRFVDLLLENDSSARSKLVANGLDKVVVDVLASEFFSYMHPQLPRLVAHSSSL